LPYIFPIIKLAHWSISSVQLYRSVRAFTQHTEHHDPWVFLDARRRRQKSTVRKQERNRLKRRITSPKDRRSDPILALRLRLTSELSVSVANYCITQQESD